MHKALRKFGCVAGLLTPFWLLVGLALAGALYPGYSHLNQAMSELGALGAPTHELSPLINNLPLGLLFFAFGVTVFACFEGRGLAQVSGVLIALHGIASLFTGYFSCDAGCGLQHPSFSQTVHNSAWLMMFLTLVIANALWVYLAARLLGSKAFAWFSLACTLVAVAALPLMGLAAAAGEGFGLYQRLNYGASVVWIGVFAALLLVREKRRADHA